MLLKGKTVFIVEDNQLNLNIALLYLERQGAKVHFCRRPRELLGKLLNVLPVDIILMDLMLSNTSGFDIFTEVRSTLALQTIPVVAISASDPDAAMPRARELGFAGYIAKPITYHISRQVSDVLRGREVWIADGNECW